MIKKSKGITLIVLVITIIILLILTGISIVSLTDNKLFEKAKIAKETTENEQKKENKILQDYYNQIDNLGISSGNRENSKSGEWFLLKRTTSSDGNEIYKLENEDKFSNYKSVAVVMDYSDYGIGLVNSCIVGVNVFKEAVYIQSYVKDNVRGSCTYISDTEFKLCSIGGNYDINLYGIK